MPGRLIVFEGIDGSGKSTQFNMLCHRLTAKHYQFKRLVFPRYDKPSSTLVKMYLNGEFGTDPGDVNAYAASSFFAADRYASYIQDWRGYYESGGLVLTDRYTTSNALHQGAKMAKDERERFFKWLYDYEFNLIKLPEPSLVVYMNIDVSLAVSRLSSRRETTGEDADIHEQDFSYLKSCARSGALAAAQYGWHIVDCEIDGSARSQDEIHNEIFKEILLHI